MFGIKSEAQHNLLDLLLSTEICQIIKVTEYVV